MTNSKKVITVSNEKICNLSYIKNATAAAGLEPGVRVSQPYVIREENS